MSVWFLILQVCLKKTAKAKLLLRPNFSFFKEALQFCSVYLYGYGKLGKIEVGLVRSELVLYETNRKYEIKKSS